jgi:hypothetical protein
MTFSSNVAPRRWVRQEKHRPWMCRCCDTETGEPIMQPAAVKRCFTCLAIRP